MNKHRLYRIIIFFLIFLSVLFGVSRFFLRFLRASNNHEYFYSIPENSIDVVFVGSSHSYCCFSPMELYDKYGISSYNFASSNQSMLASYLWAKEAYDHQKYKVLVVEAMSVTMSHGDIENDIRSLYSMGMSSHYFELVKTYKRQMYKVIFPVFAIHDTWENIGELTYRPVANENAVYLRGYVPLDSEAGTEYTTSILSGSKDDEFYINFTYIDKIREFCEENNIKLIFVKTLMASNEVNNWNDGYHNALQNYADEYGIPFIDFNSTEYLNDAGLDISTDVASDLRHMNISGGEKVTDYLGQFILGLNDISITVYDEKDGIDQSTIDQYHEIIGK